MKDHIRGDEGAVEDEGGDVNEPFPGFEALPPDAEREVDGHRETGTTHEEDKKREDFRGRKRHRYMYRLGSVGTYRSFVNCCGCFLHCLLYVSLVHLKQDVGLLKQWNILFFRECLIWLGFSGKTFTFSALVEFRRYFLGNF